MNRFLVLTLIISIMFSMPVITNAQQDIYYVKANKAKVMDKAINKTGHFEQENRRVDIIDWITEEITDYVYDKIMDFIETIKPDKCIRKDKKSYRS
ncbi:hypothetical protein [Acetivibrio cellulolyticus]|uniref:hypothetical protein n=1 Tax=Acetivibrio cellulolyticus TaxID=35830 RepID=UPI0001E2F0CD|nr:hypothetical protein [Acetivibrio cellulolyticus]